MRCTVFLTAQADLRRHDTASTGRGSGIVTRRASTVIVAALANPPIARVDAIAIAGKGSAI